MNNVKSWSVKLLNLIAQKKVSLLRGASVMLFFVFHGTIAAIYSTIDKVEVSGIVFKETRYTYTIRAWDYDDGASNPCYKLPACTIAISHRHYSDGRSGSIQTGWRGSKVPCILSSRTIGELGICLRDNASSFGAADEGSESGIRLNIPFVSTTLHSGGAVTQECVGIFYATHAVASSEQKLIMLPGSVCGIAPPPAGACKMADNLEINHGVLDVTEVNGASAESVLNIDCNQAIPAKIYLDNTEGTISLSDDIKSIITANGAGVKDGAKINLAQGANSIRIRSQLTTSSLSVGSGEFQASGVLILTLQ
ncbi:MrpH family fimbial adhesin [Enterobacter cloacae]|uniref:MrpH family fimbial adhesin n=1 Tax=Enterobacter cloacae TaxID=550 RepID=UPI0033549FBD